MLNELSTKIGQSLDSFTSELAGIRAGRASAGLVENLMADVYGNKMAVKGLASIMVPDAKSIVIQPWDKANLAPIEKAIADSDLSLNPVNDGEVLRINIPPLSEERRLELIKLLGQKAEAARIAVRNLRQDVMSKLDRDLKEKAIGEDEHSRAQKQVQDKVNEANAKIDELLTAKESEIKTV